MSKKPQLTATKTERTDVRLSLAAKKQLEDLMVRWGESKSNAIRRAIAIAHGQK